MRNLDKGRNLAAACAYSLFFITGIVVLVVEKEDKFVRFHAMQSTVLFGGLFILNIIIGIMLSPFAIFDILGSLISTLISLVSTAVWLASIFMAYSGKLFKWPIVGALSERLLQKYDL